MIKAPMDDPSPARDAFSPSQAEGSARLPAHRIQRSPDVIAVGKLPGQGPYLAVARMPGAKLTTAEVRDDPTVQRAAASGLTFVFRYGVAVTFTNMHQSLDALDAVLKPHVGERAESIEVESVGLTIRPDAGDRLMPGGDLVLADASIERLQLVATVLSQSVVLARSETLVSDVFDRSALIITDLRETGRTRLPINAAMKLVGNVLAARHRLMGTVQVGERPDMLWDFPELERLYVRLEAEYEIGERAEVLDRKFTALGDFATALLDIVQQKRSFRLELAIIALIAVEALLALWALVPR